MILFLHAAWPNFLFVPRGTIYTFRNANDGLATEMTGTAGSISCVNTSTPPDFPVATTPTRDNTFLGNLLVASYDSSALGGTVGWTYYHSDHLGTPRYITGVEGPFSPKYWPYGEEVTQNTTSQKLRFATMERDLEVNRFFDHARSHDFNLGRFISPEPAWLGSPWAPLTWNRYVYANGTPIVNRDPDGRQAVAAIAIAAGVGGLYNGAMNVALYVGESGRGFSWGAAAGHFGVGFVSGASGTALTAWGTLTGQPFLGGAVGGAATSYLNQLGNNIFYNSQISYRQVAWSAGLSAITAGILGRTGLRPGQSFTKMDLSEFEVTFDQGARLALPTASGAFIGNVIRTPYNLFGRSMFGPPGTGRTQGSGGFGFGEFMPRSGGCVSGSQEIWVTPEGATYGTPIYWESTYPGGPATY
jgi:RHS repeat-associated protein